MTTIMVIIYHNYVKYVFLNLNEGFKNKYWKIPVGQLESPLENHLTTDRRSTYRAGLPSPKVNVMTGLNVGTVPTF